MEGAPLSPGSYFAELKALQAAHEARLIDKEELDCQKKQLDAIRRRQGAGVSVPLKGLQYRNHPLECGCSKRFSFDKAAGKDKLDNSPEEAVRQASLAYVPSSSAAIRALMDSPVGFVNIHEDSPGFVGMEMKGMRPVSMIDLDEVTLLGTQILAPFRTKTSEICCFFLLFVKGGRGL